MDKLFSSNNFDEIVKIGTAGLRSKNIELIKKTIVKCILFLHENYENQSGIMITASHNPHEYNGFKPVVNFGNLMDNDEEKKLNNFLNTKYYTFEKTKPSKIYIGYDPRPSSMEILNYINLSFQNIPEIKITICGMIHTPYLYSLLEKRNKNEKFDYFKEMEENFNKLYWNEEKKREPILIDFANGSMNSCRLFIKEILDKKNMEYIFINTNGLINEMCGSDHAYNTNEISITNYESNIEKSNLENRITRGVTFDGDGDRILLFDCEVKQDKIIIDKFFTGDHFICFYSDILKQIENYYRGIIFTPYSNFAMIPYLQKNSAEYIISAPGVKNLVKEAHNYEIACVFEYNGHGNIEWNKDYDHGEFQPILNLLYSKAGDVLGHFLIILNHIHSSFSYFEPKFQYQGAVKVNDMEKFKNVTTNDKETYIQQPMELSEKIDKIIYENNEKVRSVIRPSGTEPIFRILLEGNNENAIKEMFQKLKSEIENYFN